MSKSKESPAAAQNLHPDADVKSNAGNLTAEEALINLLKADNEQLSKSQEIVSTNQELLSKYQEIISKYQELLDKSMEQYYGSSGVIPRLLTILEKLYSIR